MTDVVGRKGDFNRLADGPAQVFHQGRKIILQDRGVGKRRQSKGKSLLPGGKAVSCGREGAGQEEKDKEYMMNTHAVV